MLDRNFYKGKRVLLTGHTGFKGGWLSIWLNMLGADVYGYSLSPKDKQGIYNTSRIGNNISDLRGDIRDYPNLIKIFKEVQPELVFHLAAQALVLDSYQAPLNTFEINVQGTAHVLEAIRQTPSVKAGVIITTDKCYDNREFVWGYREIDPMGGFDPYSASKGAAELVINSYISSFFSSDIAPGIASVRAGNVVGGGDWSANRLVPDIFRALKENKPIKLRNPNATRPWQHVLEPLGAYLLIGQRLYNAPRKYSSAWNIGPYPHEVYTVKQVVERIISVTARGHWIDVSNQGQLHEASSLMLDISKANKFLDWRPVLNFKATIDFTTRWYMMDKNEDVLSFSHKQINDYLDRWSSQKVN